MKIFYIIDNICVDPFEKAFDFRKYVKKKYNLIITEFKIDKRSVDARNKHSVKLLYRILAVSDQKLGNIDNFNDISLYIQPVQEQPVSTKREKRIIIIGAGPAGLFSALRLIEHGFKVCILERGKPVEERSADIKLLSEKGILDTESNVLFGEGGAGTWSDGKLTTRINKPGIEWFFDKMVEFGAHESILYDSKPHVGSDCLADIVKNIKKYIISSGSEIFFSEKVTSFIIDQDTVKGVETSSGKEFASGAVILAAGHSARDMYKYLQEINVALESKPFAVGCRVEHPREFINRAQYGKFASALPAADYRLVYNNKISGRSVFSFCMCPGGVVINSSSEQGLLCVNGMSYSDRNLENSNSAIVVSVKREDLGADPLSGIEFQRNIEKSAFNIKQGPFYSPAARIADFSRTGKGKMKISDSSYRPGVFESDFCSILPEWLAAEMQEGLRVFDRKIPGFIQNGIITGVETRTSSPVRVLRDSRCESLSHKRLFPAGEGAGYAGGIVSSAVDGIKIADILAAE